MYNTLKVEDQNSLAFLNLLQGFDYTVYTDFMHRSSRVIAPLISVGRWLGLLYIFLSLFTAGGILYRFTQFSGQPARVSFSIGAFWQACSYYIGRFGRLFGVTLLFMIIGGGIWLVAGTLLGVVLNDSLTERGEFWIGIFFFALALLTVAFVFCIGDYAKVIMFREDERQAFRAFGRAGRLVLNNLSKTYVLYCLLILIGTALFGVYFLLDELILMSSWLTILLMFLVQQSLVFARVGLKVWSLGMAYVIYETFPKPQPVLRPIPIAAPTDELAQTDAKPTAEESPNQPN
jgi:MFS family permease